MTQVLVPLIAHYNGQTGRREVSLRILAIDAKVMLVLWDNKLVPVHSPMSGLKLDVIEVFSEPVEKKLGRPAKVQDEEKAL